MGWVDDLIAFLNARLDEREDHARRLLCIAQETSLALKDPALLGRYIPGWYSWGDIETLCAATLREVEAKRMILARYTAAPDWTGGEDVKILATVHGNHPGYQEEWKP